MSRDGEHRRGGRTTLIVTNDFGPRVGGIESFLGDVAALLDGNVVVLTSTQAGSARFDAGLGYPVHRYGRLLLPTPALAGTAAGLLQRHHSSRVVFGAAAPLGLLAGPLRRAGARRLLGLTHGHETWWAAVPGPRQLLRRIGAATDLSTISDYAERRIARALRPVDAARLVRIPPPVDTAVFRPDRGRRPSRPVLVSAARLVARKNVASLLTAWSLVLRDPVRRGRLAAAWPAGADPELVIVGDGPERPALGRRAVALRVADSVRFIGAVPRTAVVEHLQAATAFALPVRTRRAGLDAEGLGLVFAEAAACGLPVLVGNSGGAPETVEEGVTGYVVDGRDPETLAERIVELLADPVRAAAMGAAGRRLVAERFAAPVARAALCRALDLD